LRQNAASAGVEVRMAWSNSVRKSIVLRQERKEFLDKAEGMQSRVKKEMRAMTISEKNGL